MRPNGPGKQPAAISDAPLDLEEETLSVLARAIAHPHCDAVRHEHLSFKFHDKQWRRRRYSWQVQLCAGLILESHQKNSCGPSRPTADSQPDQLSVKTANGQVVLAKRKAK